MRPTMKRISTWAIVATSVMILPLISATQSEAGNRHPRKHHARASQAWNNPARRSWASEQVHPLAPAHAWGTGSGDVCPGNARAIDCKIWPPPIYDDPDRRQSGSDAGG